MSLSHSEYNCFYCNNNTSHTVIVINGWGFPGESFQGIISDSFLVISDYNPVTLSQYITEIFNRYSIKTYSVVGFSLGALWLSLNYSLFPHSKGFFFLSARPSFSQNAIRPIMSLLHRDKKACLTQFFQNCFSSSDLAEKYLTPFFSTSLLFNFLHEGLDFLQTYSFSPAIFEDPSISYCFIHGKRDRISPYLPFLKWFKRYHQDTSELISVKHSGHFIQLNTLFDSLILR